jgi:pilus assembly protein FimV
VPDAHASDAYAAALAADPVDTKLDLARAYLDMGDPVGARAMLEEVLEEGSQPQKDEATRLMAEAVG